MKLKYAASLFAALTLVASAAQPDGDAAKEDLKKLKGKWKIVAVEFGGMNTPLDKAGIAMLEFKGDKLSLLNANGVASKTFPVKLDPSKKPKHMDWIGVQPSAPPVPAIYAVDGDELKICFPLYPKKGEKPAEPVKRPENFDTTDRPAGLFIAKREKS